jgi:DNA helicase-2/ATP-dependent DNA helicase PcrA
VFDAPVTSYTIDMAGFEEEYKKLNDQQREAVDHTEGPLLVIAGPGTGKTQLLSMRVANILRVTDTDPANILCLTFTNKAATNMRERLMKLGGPYTKRVMVKTFHGFAAEIMNMYPEYFWNGARLSTAPDAVQLEIIQTILTRLPLDNPLALKFAGKYTAIKSVQEALKLTKEAGLTPENLKAIIKVNLAYIDSVEEELIDILSPSLGAKKLSKLRERIQALSPQGIQDTLGPLRSLTTIIQDSLDFAIAQDEPTGKIKNTSKWKQRWIQTIEGKKGMHDERKRNLWWLALANVYESYRNELHTRGYYDYADMLVEVIAQMEKNPEMRASVQERFLYVLIDEFQDTNGAQLRLAHLVADHHSANGEPNLMAVGDDDQSIYKFNGAELNNMLLFRSTYPTSRLIVLEDNYRSSQEILDTAKKIIEQADDRLVKREKDISKNLRAVNAPKVKGTITHQAFPTREHQLSAVAKNIKQLRDKNDQSIAVLARSHDSLQQIASLLLRQGVPVRYEQQSNILEHEAVVQASLIAGTAVAIQNGNQLQVNYSISQTLRHPMWGIAPKTLWELALSNRSHANWLDSLLTSEASALQSIGEWFLWLAQEAAYQPLPVLMEYILGLRGSETFTSPLRAYFASRRAINNDYLHALSAIQMLRTLVSEFSHGTKPTLEDFVRFISLNQDNEKIIADESLFVSDGDAVELYTVHKAKGLEFEVVFIIDAIEDNWQPFGGGKKPPANLPLKPTGDDSDDYARLMYVAATRAKHSLHATSYYEDHAGKELLPTPLISGAINDSARVSVADAGNVITVLEDNLTWPRLNSEDERAMLKGQLEAYSLSVTNLLNFLDLTSGGPDYFLERNLLRLPDTKTSSMAHGTAVHAALELGQRLTNSGSYTFGAVVDEYERALDEEHLPKEEFERYIAHGKNVLKKLFDKYGYVLPKGSLPEQNINDIKIGEATISGKLDRVDMPSETSLCIVDYKTGKSLSSFTTRDQAKAVKAWKQRTQLIFYALLVQNSPRFKFVRSVEGQMIYVEAESARDLTRSYAPSKEEIARLEKLITTVWSKIKTIEMPSVSEYSADMAGILQFEDDLINKKI